MRNSVRAKDDPFWDKRQGKGLARVRNVYADTPSRLNEGTASMPLTGQKYSYSPTTVTVPARRSKSPAPFRAPTERLLQETESGLHRAFATEEIRSRSAGSIRGSIGGSVMSSRASTRPGTPDRGNRSRASSAGRSAGSSSQVDSRIYFFTSIFFTSLSVSKFFSFLISSLILIRF